MKRFLSQVVAPPTAPRAFCFSCVPGLTAAMTWPWVTHLRDAASDPVIRI